MADRLRDACVRYSPAVSKGGVALTTALAPVVVWKYFNTGTNPFNENSTIPSILIAAILVHIIFGFLMRYIDRSLILISFCICLVSGVLAYELLLFILVPRIWKLAVINVSLALLIALACFYKKFASLSTCFGQPAGTRVADEQQEAADGVEMTAGTSVEDEQQEAADGVEMKGVQAA